MALLPKPSGDFQSVDFSLLPPSQFITGLVQLAMVAAAERHGELVADLRADGARLRKAEVVGVAGLPSADEARL